MRAICAGLILFIVIQDFILAAVIKRRENLIIQSFHQKEKYRIFFEMTSSWLKGLAAGKDITAWIEKKGYQRVAVYGMGDLGEITLAYLRKNSRIEVLYALDKKKNIQSNKIKIYSLDECLEPVDLIIVTAVMSFEEIKNEITEKTAFECPIMSLAQLLEEMYV